MRLVPVVAGALLCATGALAQTAPDGLTKKICRSERVTGSLTRVRKLCLTQAEWDSVAASARKTVSDVSRSSGVSNGALDTPTGRANAAQSGQAF